MTRQLAKTPELWEEDYQYSPDFEDNTKMSEIMTYRLDPAADFEGKAVKPPSDVPPYLAELFRFPVLTRHGERMLFLKMNYAKYMATKLRKAGCGIPEEEITYYVSIARTTRNKIAEHNLRLVVHLAKKAMIPTMTFDEIISNGNISLLRAIDKFDANRKNQTGGTNKFSTYATWAITKNLWRDRENINTKSLPILDADISDYGIPDPRTQETTVSDDSDDADLLLKKMHNRDILTEREEEILLDRWGVGRDDELTLAQIGDKMGITKERVRQIQIKAVAKVRGALEVTMARRRAYRRQTAPKSATSVQVSEKGNGTRRKGSFREDDGHALPHQPIRMAG